MKKVRKADGSIVFLESSSQMEVGDTVFNPDGDGVNYTLGKDRQLVPSRAWYVEVPPLGM